MTFGLKWRLLDVAFATTLVLLAATPLVFLRASPLWGQPEYSGGLAALIFGTLALWAILLRRDRRCAAPSDLTSQSEAHAAGHLTWWQVALVAGLLGVVTFACFYVPLRVHFWAGVDDFLSLKGTALIPWVIEWDHSMNRPFTVLPCVIGRNLTPDRIEGFVWLAAGMCWLNGLLLFAVLREVLPQARLLPVVAAVLFLIDRAEPSRFLVMWTSNYYWFSLALFLMGAWLFLWSYRRGVRLLLVPACALLGGALLTLEAAYPLALLVPVLAWLSKEHRRRLPAWSIAWLGTVAVCAARFVFFMAHRGADAYQARQSGEVLRDPKLLWSNLRLHLKASLANFQTTGAALDHWKANAAILALVVVLACLVYWRGGKTPAPRRRAYLVGLVLGCAALLLGTAPFLSMPFVFRTQFFAAPGQAVALACVLCLAGSLLGRRCGPAAVLVAVGLLAINAGTESLAEQHQKDSQSPISFERTVHIFRQIHAVCPNPTPDTLILIYFDEAARSPFLTNYCCVYISRVALGTNAVVANHKDPFPIPGEPVFHPDGISLKQGQDIGCPGKAAYEKVLGFRVAADDTVTVLKQLPPELLPPGHAGDRYDPVALIRTGPVAEMPYLRYPRWAARPRDLFDQADGILLGRGWGKLDGSSRRVEDGAELLVNPLGQTRREIRLDVAADRTGVLEAVDATGTVVATAGLAGRGRVSLTVPTDPERVGLIRLRLAEGGGGLRAFCP